MKFIVVCEYTGSRHTDPLHQFDKIEAVGGFDSYDEATTYARKYFDDCMKHTVVRFVKRPEVE